MVRTYSRRSMLATALLPVLPPAFADIPAAPVHAAEVTLAGFPLRVEFRPDGTSSTDPDVLVHVRGEHGGVFAFIHCPSDERRAALARWDGGDRSAEVIDALIRS